MAIHVITSPGVISRKNAKRYLGDCLIVPDTVTSIEEESFARQPKIRSIQFSNSLSHIGPRAFIDCIHLTELHMPDTITAFGKEAFSGCKGLKTVYISASVKNIPERAFYKCRGMESVLLPEGIQKIGEEAFYFASIKELSIPSTVVSIKDKAFFRCNRLTSVVIPSNVKHLGTEIFHGCNYLKTLEIAYDPEYIGHNIVNRSTTIRCCQGSKVDIYCKNHEIPTEYIPNSYKSD